MNDIEILKNMINDAKARNDDVLVEYLNKALAHIMEKQKLQEDVKSRAQENTNQEQNAIQEEKKEVVIEQEKEKEEEKVQEEKTITNGNTTLTRQENGNIILTSDYMDVKVNSTDSNLKLSLESILVTIALDEIKIKQGRQGEAMNKLSSLIANAKSEEELKDIEMYLSDISSVGLYGAELFVRLSALIDSRKNDINKKPDTNSYMIGNELADVEKKISLYDMQTEEIMNSSNPDDYYELAGKYDKEITELEHLQHMSNDPEEKQRIKMKIEDLKDRVLDLRKLAIKIEETKVTFEM